MSLPARIRETAKIMSPSGDYFLTDNDGRTILFFHAETGNLQEVERIIFSLPGTGIYCQRLALINHKDKNGLTAADVAARNGHEDIAKLLRSEAGRMEFFE